LFIPGNGSLNLDAESKGEEEVEVGVLTAGALVVPKEADTWCNGEAGRLLPDLDRELVPLCKLASGEGWNGVVWIVPLPALGVSSSSASSEMSHTLGAPEWIYDSSARRKGLRVRFGERSGEEGLPRGIGEGERERWPLGLMTVGSE
jgi:hypothetical protein